MNHYKARILGFGNVTVAYRFVDEEWRCTALQFDIVGTGASKAEAFEQMQELVNSYLIHVFRAQGKVSFFNPADRDEWESADKAEYQVLVSMPDEAPGVSQPAMPDIQFEKVKAMGERVEEFELIPA